LDDPSDANPPNGPDTLTGDGSGQALPPIGETAAASTAPARSINDRDVERDSPTEDAGMPEGFGHSVTQASADAIAAACKASGFPAPELRIREEEA
jgi:hypothetical protein